VTGEPLVLPDRLARRDDQLRALPGERDRLAVEPYGRDRVSVEVEVEPGQRLIRPGLDGGDRVHQLRVGVIRHADRVVGDVVATVAEPGEQRVADPGRTRNRPWRRGGGGRREAGDHARGQGGDE
jgi:hypothetical protein